MTHPIYHITMQNLEITRLVGHSFFFFWHMHCVRGLGIVPRHSSSEMLLSLPEAVTWKNVFQLEDCPISPHIAAPINTKYDIMLTVHPGTELQGMVWHFYLENLDLSKLNQDWCAQCQDRKLHKMSTCVWKSFCSSKRSDRRVTRYNAGAYLRVIKLHVGWNLSVKASGLLGE